MARSGAAESGSVALWHGSAGVVIMSTLRDQLLAIYDERGALTPALVVDTARDPEHPLHHRLEWDDRKAGAAWRLEQAAQLIRSVRLVYAEDDNGPRDLRAFSAVRGEETPKSNYIPTEAALADPITRTILLRQMRRDWLAFKRRYEHMQEFAALITADLKEEAS